MIKKTAIVGLDIISVPVHPNHPGHKWAFVSDLELNRLGIKIKPVRTPKWVEEHGGDDYKNAVFVKIPKKKRFK